MATYPFNSISYLNLLVKYILAQHKLIIVYWQTLINHLIIFIYKEMLKLLLILLILMN